MWIVRIETAPSSMVPPSVERLERELDLRRRVHVDGAAVIEREPSVAREMVGVRVRLEHADQPHVLSRCLLEVLLDRVGRVDDHGCPLVLIADQVRRAAEAVVDELVEDHELAR